MSETTEILKVDDDQRIVFGWANVIQKDGKVVVDRQGDFIRDAEALEKTAYDYVLHSRDGGDMHLRKGVATIIESVVFTPEKMEAMGIEKGTLPIGWWIGMKVHDDEVWGEVKKGAYSGFSIGGRGMRQKVQVGEDFSELGKGEPTSEDVHVGEKKKKKKPEPTAAEQMGLKALDTANKLLGKAGFDPNQPRDATGKWIDTGTNRGLSVNPKLRAAGGRFERVRTLRNAALERGDTDRVKELDRELNRMEELGTNRETGGMVNSRRRDGDNHRNLNRNAASNWGSEIGLNENESRRRWREASESLEGWSDLSHERKLKFVQNKLIGDLVDDIERETNPSLKRALQEKLRRAQKAAGIGSRKAPSSRRGREEDRRRRSGQFYD